MLRKEELTIDELMLLNSEMRREEKSLALTYLMLIGGHLGLHRFYLKRYGSGAAQLALFVAAVIAYVGMAIGQAVTGSEETPVVALVLFLLIAAVLTVWVIIDLFIIPKIVKALNGQTEQAILAELTRIRKIRELTGPGAKL